MNKNKIYTNIRRHYLRELIFPVILTVFLCFAWVLQPYRGIYSPNTVESLDEIREHFEADQPYIKITLRDLRNTGYDYIRLGHIHGTYYYTFLEDTCVLVLLSEDSVSGQTSPIEELTVKARIVEQEHSYPELMGHLARDLNWTEEELSAITWPFIISQADYSLIWPSILYLLLLFATLSAVLSVFLNLCFVICPWTSPDVRRLKCFGDAKMLLAKSVSQLQGDLLLTAGQMYVTEQFFLDLTARRTLILPIRNLIWIYCHKRKRKKESRRVVYYNLHLITENGMSAVCVKRTAQDVDAVITYLQNLNSRILVGYSEENKDQARKEIQEFQEAKKKRADEEHSH